MTARIEALRATVGTQQFARPYVSARGSIAEREIVRVELRTNTGEIAIGETASLSLRGGGSGAEIAAEIEGAGASALREADAALVEALGQAEAAATAVATIVAACETAGLGREALCAIDLALHDLAGRRCGVPVWRLLGADENPEPITCNATLVAGEPGSVAEDACEWAAAGFRSFKLKAGLPNDVTVFAAVSEALGTQARLRLDANGAWDVPTALEQLAALVEVAPVELIEQPCGDESAMARVAASTEVPVAADESVVDAASARTVAGLGAAAMATVKLAKVGGIAAGLAIAEQLPVYVSSALDGPLGIAAGAHLAAALRARGLDAGIAHGLATEKLFAEWPADPPARLEGEMLHLPTAPGLGLV